MPHAGDSRKSQDRHQNRGLKMKRIKLSTWGKTALFRNAV